MGISLPLRRLTAFGTCSLLLFACAALIPESAGTPLNLHTARMAARCLGVFGIPVQLNGLTLSGEHFAVQVVSECSVLQMALLFFSFVVSFPASRYQKLVGLTLGGLSLHAVNILRIALLFAAGLKGAFLFDLCHLYLGQVLMVLAVCTACLAWLYTLQPDRNDHQWLAFLIRFLGISGVLFLLWLSANVAYVRLIDHAVRYLFSRFDYTLAIPYRHAIYYQTFNVVACAGLILAERSSFGRKLALLAGGFLICASLQLADRTCDVLVTTFQSVAAGRAELLIGFVAGYLVPILFWLLARKPGQQEYPTGSALDSPAPRR
jgi:exosortase H (IPTLxxWG-CTERM-specific)